MTEEHFTDEQGNVVTKKVGAESPLSWAEGFGLTLSFLLPPGSDGTVWVPAAVPDMVVLTLPDIV